MQDLCVYTVRYVLNTESQVGKQKEYVFMHKTSICIIVEKHTNRFYLFYWQNLYPTKGL